METFEASQQRDAQQSTISMWCRDGKIPGIEHDKKGSPWHIPKDAVCPKTKKEG